MAIHKAVSDKFPSDQTCGQVGSKPDQCRGEKGEKGSGRTVLTVMMHKGIGARNLILLSNDSVATTEHRGCTVDTQKRFADAGVWNPMAESGKVASNHTATKMRKDGENVSEESIQLMVGESGDRGSNGTMKARSGPITVSNIHEDRGAWVDEAVAQRLTTNVAG